MQTPPGLHIPLSDILANDTRESGSDMHEMQGIKTFDYILPLCQILNVMKRLTWAKNCHLDVGVDLVWEKQTKKRNCLDTRFGPGMKTV
jgi:hypothetical protein